MHDVRACLVTEAGSDTGRADSVAPVTDVKFG